MADVIAKHAAARGDVAALIDDEGTTTWSQLDERVNRLIHALRARGVSPAGRSRRWSATGASTTR